MHHICGLLLLYSMNLSYLPQTLYDLKSLPGFADVKDFVCPLSKKPYIYNPDGIPSPNNDGVLILYDSTPAHSGMRWAISIVPPQGNGSLVTKVIAVPDQYFAQHSIDVQK